VKNGPLVRQKTYKEKKRVPRNKGRDFQATKGDYQKD
jgi:hypothetical protein